MILKNNDNKKNLDQNVSDFYDKIAKSRKKWLKRAASFHREDQIMLREMIIPESKILELGCGNGQLLNSLNPSSGIGVDISKQYQSSDFGGELSQAQIKYCANDVLYLHKINDALTKILKRENVLDDDEGHRYWMTELSKGSDRKSIEDYEQLARNLLDL